MFKSGKDTIIPEPTPERVFTIAEYIKKHNYTAEKMISKADLQSVMCMSEIFTQSNNSDIFNHAWKAGCELEIFAQSDNNCYGTEKLAAIKNMDDFRKYAAALIFQHKDSLFYKITSLYLQNAEIMQSFTKWESVLEAIQKADLDHDPSINYNAILGWRFWACFLGEGYLHFGMLIPNMARRFADVIATQKDYKTDSPIKVSDFIEWLEYQCPEMASSRDGANLGLAVSNGLRTLDELGIISLKRVPDAEQWLLYKFESNNEVSHVSLTGRRQS